MHSFIVDCDTFSNDEKVTVAVQITSLEATCSDAMQALCFSSLASKFMLIRLGSSAQGQLVGNGLGQCLFESVLTIRCSSLLEDARIIFSM